MSVYTELYSMLEKLYQNEEKQQQIINLVPSENYISPIARIPMLLDVYNRYFFNSKNEPEDWNFRGVQSLFTIETEIATSLLKEFTGAKHINLRPLSGLSCMMLALNALGGSIGSKILILAPNQGGHSATRNIAESYGYSVEFIESINEHFIDYKKLGEQLTEQKISLIYLDQSNFIFPIDIDLVVKTVRENSSKTLIHVDASHTLGLIFGGVIKNPLDSGVDSFAGSTHKTFPGPQKAVFFTNSDNIAQAILNKQTSMISNHHFASVCSLAISLLEFKKDGEEYSKRIIQNAKSLAEHLKRNGLDVKGSEYGFTDCHQIWFSTKNLGVSAYEASDRLYEVGINVNAFKEGLGSSEPIIRIGVNEISRNGAKAKNMEKLANIITETILKKKLKSELILDIESWNKQLVNNYGFQISDEETKKIIYKIIDRVF